LHQSPAARDQSCRQVKQEPLIGSESLEFFGQLEGLGYIPADMMEEYEKNLRRGQAGGMTQVAGKRECLPSPLQSLFGIAKHSKLVGHKAKGGPAGVIAAVEKCMRAVLTAVI